MIIPPSNLTDVISQNAVAELVLQSEFSCIKVITINSIIAILGSGKFLVCTIVFSIDVYFYSIIIFISTAGSPQLLLRPNDAIIPSTQTVQFRCAGDGIPTPQLDWYRENEKLNSSERVFILPQQQLNHLTVSSILEIHDTMPSDAGLYRCVVENKAGSAESSFQLTINSRFKHQRYYITRLFCNTYTIVLFQLLLTSLTQSWIPFKL